MLSADAVNLELLRQGNRIMQQKVTALGSQLRAAEQKCEVLQTKLLQMEQTEIERSCKHDSHEEAQMNAVLKQLLSECVDIEDFMTSSRAGVADRATELSEDHKHALAETKSLRFELTQVEVKLKCTESAVKEANALLSKEVEQREAIQEHERALMEQVKDLQDESRHTRTQCDGLKNKLHEERNRCRQLELEGKRMQQARLTACNSGSVDSHDDERVVPSLPTVASTEGVGAPPAPVLDSPPPRLPGQCPQCAEPSYGLMVRCVGCAAGFHVACARKERQGGGGGSDPAGRFQCAACLEKST